MRYTCMMQVCMVKLLTSNVTWKLTTIILNEHRVSQNHGKPQFLKTQVFAPNVHVDSWAGTKFWPGAPNMPNGKTIRPWEWRYEFTVWDILKSDEAFLH
jgi:hypothetical protein